MSNNSENRLRGGSSKNVRRRLNEEDEIIQIPAFDFSDLIAKHDRTLVGRMFHREGRSIDGLIAQLPKRRIWDVEGCVKGKNLGNGKFQFDFDTEADLQKVLSRRPCHFNKWSFSLERWEPNIRDDFPNSMVFWAQISGVPTHYRKDQVYRGIGKALGTVSIVDVEKERVKVSLNADKPLQFERRVGFENGDVVKVKITYEDLYRWCFTCNKISHQEGTCPELSEADKERNRIARLEQREKEEAISREMFSYIPPTGVLPRRAGQGRGKSPETEPRREPRNDHAILSETNRSNKDLRNDLRNEIQNKRDSRAKDVWKRVEDRSPSNSYRSRNVFRSRDGPQVRERYHPYEDREKIRRRDHYHRDIPNQQWRKRESGGNSVVRDSKSGESSQKDVSQTAPSRQSPDSQKTISEYYYDRNGHLRTETYIRRQQPPPLVKEWRPIRRVATETDPQIGPERREETEEQKSRRLKGKVPETELSGTTKKALSHAEIAMPISGKSTTSRALITEELDQVNRLEESLEPGNDSLIEEAKLLENDKDSLKDDVGKDLDDLPTEEEMTKLAEQYDDLAMDDEMLDNDDLLVEDMACDVLAGAEKIGALEEIHIPNLSTSVTRNAVSPKGDKNQSEANLALNVSTSIKVGVNRLQHTPASPNEKGWGGKKKSARSAEVKGASASKKFQALRTRASPKIKSFNPRTGPYATARNLNSNVPRMEVVPAITGNKKSIMSGSVVSQKPSSKKI